jgi:HSP20 family protein
LASFSPNADVIVDDDGGRVVAIVEVAGADPESLRVVYGERDLVISGRRREPVTRRYGSFFQKEIAVGEFVKRIALPCAIEYERIAATYEDGLLVVSAPIATTSYLPAARTELHILIKRTHS